MKASFESLGPEETADLTELFALEVLEGLSKNPRGLPSKYFYDDKGSRLFQQIMNLPEYYPTYCEQEIFVSHRDAIVDLLKGDELDLVELGAGDGRKTCILIEGLLEKGQPFRFVPLDISAEAVRMILGTLGDRFSEHDFEASGLVADYFQGLTWMSRNSTRRKAVLFLGSTIGNFNYVAALRFLRQLWYSLNSGDRVLIGFDLKKDPRVLHAAYNDVQGVTSEFNLNLLDRMNRELNADFDRKGFVHQGFYNVESGAMESYIISLKKQTVNIRALDKSFEFVPWEGIHTEYSYKYLDAEVEDLASSTGYRIVSNFKDSRNYYMDTVWEVVK